MTGPGELQSRSTPPRDHGLADGAETFRLLIEKSPIPMAVTDLDGRFEFLNDRFLALFGYTLADLPDLEAWWRRAYQDEGYRAEVLAVWRESQALDGHWDGTGFKSRDYRVTCADGAVRIMKIGGTRIGSKRLFLFLDITRRIQAEEEASRLREQLYQSQKMEAIGRLAAGVAHDFNNLLTSILGYSNLIRLEEAVPPSVREGLAEIESTARRAAELTKRLLAFSRKQNLKPAVLDLNDIIRGMERMLRRTLGENVTLAASLGATRPCLTAEPGQIDQLIVNLAVNAHDAMPDGGVLTIATRNVPPEGEREECVEIEVSDTGCGMSPEVKAHLFEPFFTTKEPGKGTGLGLSTVYGIVMQGGGRVAVESERGRGTTFRILFPCAEGADAPDAPAAAGGPRGGTETVLVVEDEETLLGLTSRVLEERGYRVIRERDPVAALGRLAAREHPRVDLLLTDVVMPGLNGRDLVERALPAQPGLKVLFMSGYSVQDVLPRAVLGRDVEFLQKPFLPAELARRVREVLDGTGSPPAPHC